MIYLQQRLWLKAVYALPGITNSFLPKDIDDASELFKSVAKNNGILLVSLELPLQTAIYAIKKANQMGIKVFFDPGGIDETENYSELLKQNIYLIKPNEHEAKILTSIAVIDFDTAKKAATKLLGKGTENVLITVGVNGGYFFNKIVGKHIPIPKMQSGCVIAETRFVDQTMAALCTALAEDKDILEAINIGLLAGTLQFGKSGIVPITKKEINKYLHNRL